MPEPSDPSFEAELRIGGKVSTKSIQKIEEYLYKDTKKKFSFDRHSKKGHFVLKCFVEDGRFYSTEEYLSRSKISFTRETWDTEQTSHYMSVSIPGKIDFLYDLDGNGEVMIPAHLALLELQSSLKTITFENAPLHIHDWQHKEYAKHLLRGDPILDFILKELDAITPPPIPELKPLRILEDNHVPSEESEE